MKINVFETRKPEMDDFEGKKKTLVLKERYLGKPQQKLFLLAGPLRPYFWPNIATNLLKDFDFANIASIDILICRLK